VLAAAQVALEPRGSGDFLRTLTFDQVGQVLNLSPYAIDPRLWIAFVAVGLVVTVALARTRWGWFAAVAFSTLATPRLLTYLLMDLLAGVRAPSGAPAPAEEAASGEAVEQVGEAALEGQAGAPADQPADA
jgi:hypothetical protein